MSCGQRLGTISIAVVGLSIGGSHWAFAASPELNRAVAAYNANRFLDAASAFLALEGSKNREEAEKATYYAARSLMQAGFPIAASRLFADVFQRGDQHLYFLKATENLIDIAMSERDELWAPQVLNKGYSKEFARLKGAWINRLNFLIGVRVLLDEDPGEARAFLDAVREHRAAG